MTGLYIDTRHIDPAKRKSPKDEEYLYDDDEFVHIFYSDYCGQYRSLVNSLIVPLISTTHEIKFGHYLLNSAKKFGCTFTSKESQFIYTYLCYAYPFCDEVRIDDLHDLIWVFEVCMNNSDREVHYHK